MAFERSLSDCASRYAPIDFIIHSLITSYHPMSNRQAEWIVKEVKKSLKAKKKGYSLKIVRFFFRTTTLSLVTGVISAELLY